jgi:uncharacterized protein (TIGR02996 family)
MQAMVHDDPHDVDTRRIYADWLEQTASPRAEFLRLQLKAYDGRALKKDRARIEKLIAQHGLSWLGAIAPHVQDVDWHLGFPSGADVKFRGRRQRDAALQLPGWQTLTEATTRDPIVTAHPALANVRQLGRTSPLIGTANRVTPQPVSAIDTPTPLPITDLVIDADDVALVDFAHLPALRRLNIRHRNSRIVDPMDFKGYIEALTPLHLERLTTWHINAELWLSLRQVLPHVHRFEVAAPWSFRFGVEQRADGLHLDIVWPWPESNRSFHTPRQVALALEPDRVTIHTPGYNHRAERLQRWAKALRPAEVTLPKARRVRRS